MLSFLRSIKDQFRHGDSLTRILTVNVVIFALIAVYQLILFITETLPPTFLGNDLGLAANSSWTVMIYRPWSILTHMFTHINFGHFLFNMVALYSMGKMFLALVGSKKLLHLYVMGGLSGYILFAVVYSLSDVLGNNEAHAVLGASAAVMAIVVAAAVIRPLQKIFLFGIVQLELRWLALILVLLDLASIKDGINSGGHIGHLGGAFFGLYYGNRIIKGNETRDFIGRLFEKIKATFSRNKLHVVQGHARPKSDEQFNLEKKKRQQRIDQILDKISRSGYESLSKDEKDFLFRHSDK
jgi:membrane associated rhomboid family serine protease